MGNNPIKKEYEQVYALAGEHGRYPELLGLAFYAIKRISFTLGSNAEAEEKLGEAGAIKFMSDALAKYPNDANVQFHCLGAMGNLCTNKQNQARVHHTDGIERAVKAMQMFPDHEQVQKQGCFFINTSAMSRVTLQQILHHDAIDVVIKAMSRFPLDQDIHEAAFGVFSNGTYLSDKFAKSIMDHGGISAIIGHLQRYDKKYHCNVFTVLFNLSLNHFVKKLMVADKLFFLIAKRAKEYFDAKDWEDLLRVLNYTEEDLADVLGEQPTENKQQEATNE